MNYTEKQTKFINIASILMLIYALIALVALKTYHWPVPGILLFCINIINFLLWLFPETNKKFTAILCIIVGFFSVILLQGIVLWMGLILGIYGIYLTYILLKE